jgi:hypothetical protein
MWSFVLFCGVINLWQELWIFLLGYIRSFGSFYFNRRLDTTVQVCEYLLTLFNIICIFTLSYFFTLKFLSTPWTSLCCTCIICIPQDKLKLTFPGVTCAWENVCVCVCECEHVLLLHMCMCVVVINRCCRSLQSLYAPSSLFRNSSHLIIINKCITFLV